jgi:hypothetical protein
VPPPAQEPRASRAAESKRRWVSTVGEGEEEEVLRHGEDEEEVLRHGEGDVVCRKRARSSCESSCTH